MPVAPPVTNATFLDAILGSDYDWVNMFIINGIAVDHKISGRDGAPWVTLVTGIANDTTMWNAQLPALDPHWRVLRYDLRGQGGSQATKPPYTIDLLLQDLVGLGDKLWIKKTHLVG